MQSLFCFEELPLFPVQWNLHHFLLPLPSIIPHSILPMKTEVQHRSLHYANPSVSEQNTGNRWKIYSSLGAIIYSPSSPFGSRDCHAPCQAMHPTAIPKTVAVTLECTCCIACVQNYWTLLCLRWIGVPEFTVFWPSSVLRKTILLAEFTET